MYQDVLRSCRFLFVLFFAFIISCGGGGGGGSSSSSGPVILSAPGNINATDGEFNDRVEISWNEVTNAKNYKVYRSLTGNVDDYQVVDSPETNSYTDSSVDAEPLGTIFYYKISTVSSDDEEGDLSNPESGYADNMPLTIGGIDASEDNTDKVAITWNSDGNSTSYEVFRTTTPANEDSYTLIDESSVNSYDDTSITPGTAYHYKVRGKTDHGTVGPFSGADMGYAILEAPIGVTATQGDDLNGIVINWSVVDQAATYRIQRSSDGTNYSQIDTATVNSYTDNSAEVTGNPGKTYHYKIAGVSAQSIVGNYCDPPVEGYVGLEVPSNVQASDGDYYGKIVVNWTGVTDATNYKVKRSVDGGSFFDVTTTADTEYIDTDVASGSTYTYKITAVTENESGESDPATGTVKNASVDTDLTFNWDANKEKSVNRSGGGYRVYYSKTPGFNIGSADRTKDVPYVSGSLSPTSTTLTFTSSDTGTWYLKVVAYGLINGTEYTNIPSGEISITIE